MQVGEDDQLKPEVRWAVGCLIGSAAIVGTLILVMLVAIALQPPTWVQVALGVALACGGGLLAWLVAAALGGTRARRAEAERQVREDAERSGSPRPKAR